MSYHDHLVAWTLSFESSTSVKLNTRNCDFECHLFYHGPDIGSLSMASNKSGYLIYQAFVVFSSQALQPLSNPFSRFRDCFDQRCYPFEKNALQFFIFIWFHVSTILMGSLTNLSGVESGLQPLCNHLDDVSKESYAEALGLTFQEEYSSKIDVDTNFNQEVLPPLLQYLATSQLSYKLEVFRLKKII